MFFVGLIGPAWRLTVTSAAERLPASGLSGAAISGVLPVALILMSAVVVYQLRRDGLAPWRDRSLLPWSIGGAALVVASVLLPLLAAAPALVVLITGFLVTAAAGMPLAFTLALTALDLSPRHRRHRLDHPADQDPGRRRFLRAAQHPAVHPRGRADGERRDLRAHRRSRDGDRRASAWRSRDGGGGRRSAVLRHLGLDRRRRVRDQLAARAVDAARRLLGRRIGERGRRGLGDGHPGSAVPDDGRAGIAREPVDRDALPGRVPARVRPGGGAPRA